MKKIVVLALGFSLALGALAQRNTFYFGDKDVREIVSSIKAFDQLITDYEASIGSLQKENDQMITDFNKGFGDQLAQNYIKKTAVNDSLISLYRSKVFELKETKQMFLEITAGNAKRRTVSSRGNNPEKLRAAADAYSIMTYTDAYVSGNFNFSQSGQVPDSDLKGLIVNDYYQKLTVTVHGPGGWMRQFNVPPNGGRALFSPRIPGSYTFYFSNGRDTKAITKDLRPGFSEFYDEDGSRYDLMATMPKGY